MYPWIPNIAVNWLENHLNKETVMFEWGSGGSTLYFADKVKKIISVEHDNLWYNEIKDRIEEMDIDNCDYFLVEPGKLLNKTEYFIGSYSSKDNKYKRKSFEAYAKFIESYPEKFFDFVFVDGRSRASCIRHATSRIKSEGYLMLDNSDRNHYNCILSFMGIHERLDFFGEGIHPDGAKGEWKTTIWRIK